MHTAYYHSPVGVLRIRVTDSAVEELHFCRADEVVDAGDTNNQSSLLLACMEQLIEYFQGHRRQFDLPIHQAGTDFQQTVWSALTEIPYGKTISYQQLAKKLGNPKVIRAAASTNGKNQIAIIVPCHRVIGSKGDLVGYGGGLWRKQWLLAHEQKWALGVQTLF